MTEPNPTRAGDGKRGCPVKVWDGPYVFRCGLGADGGICAYHGPFEQPAEPARLAAETENP